MKFEITGVFKKAGTETDCVVTVWYRSWLENVNEKVKLKAECSGEKINTKGDEEW